MKSWVNCGRICFVRAGFLGNLSSLRRKCLHRNKYSLSKKAKSDRQRWDDLPPNCQMTHGKKEDKDEGRRTFSRYIFQSDGTVFSAHSCFDRQSYNAHNWIDPPLSTWGSNEWKLQQQAKYLPNQQRPNAINGWTAAVTALTLLAR